MGRVPTPYARQSFCYPFVFITQHSGTTHYRTTVIRRVAVKRSPVARTR
jgi:hypothetical protein